ncbi:TIGR01906 family membrane protein [Gemella haemolysans]|uniref:TIGR01906 family membrane protein n=2 Tax=Gemellaceae TaxID=539738 RepID=A0AAW6B4P6_9BACL|nr:TIGR01906 family membrane protein [Gemella haemolysans]MDB6185475.1 TIGR01906 family membrane protein [Gemella haemolysans]
MRKYIIQFLIVIENFSLFISGILAIIFYNCFNLNFYKSFYQKENLAPKIGTTYEELIKNTTNLLDYLNHKAILNLDWYTDKDILHMQDVRTLYSLSYKTMIFFIVVFTISTILLIILCKKRTIFYITNTFNKVLLAFIIVIGILSCIISYNFTSFWIKFHQLLFSNDLWLLSPDESNLIQMVPEEFFISLITTIILHIFILFISLFILNTVVKKRMKNN